MKTQRFTELEALRLGDILATGPTDKKDSDNRLIEVGWLEPYDGDLSVVDAKEGAAEMFYDHNGCIRDCFLPESWLQAKRTSERRFYTQLIQNTGAQLDAIAHRSDSIALTLRAALQADLRMYRNKRLAV